MKKVLHIVGGMNIGGTETMLMNLYRKMHKDIQFDFISYYETEGYYDSEIESLGGRVIRLNSPKKVGIIKAVKELKDAIEENGQYSAVHSHTLFNCGISNLAAKLAGVKVRIAHAHTTNDNSESFIRRSYIKVMQRLILNTSTNFLACSNKAGRYLLGDNIINNKNYKVIPNYIDYKSFLNCEDKTSIREELKLSKYDKVICHIGRFIEAKNHKFLIDIVSELVKKDNTYKLLLVGNGDLESNIKDKVKELSLENNIYFMGIRDDINIILNNSDLFIFPSIYEGLGLVMLEAQGSGINCLVSEAIQPEADLNIGLVKKLKLSDGVEKWAEEAVKLLNKKRNNNLEIDDKEKVNKSLNNINKEVIELAFKEKGYDIESIESTLVNIYK